MFYLFGFVSFLAHVAHYFSLGISLPDFIPVHARCAAPLKSLPSPLQVCSTLYPPHSSFVTQESAATTTPSQRARPVSMPRCATPSQHGGASTHNATTPHRIPPQHRLDTAHKSRHDASCKR
ncbi:hypothetical protein EDB83DRAFT_1651566 [Lactarius deliciosus]|nr:hypothetical protein EDB83DRAFT_1651566 [Lactarius deliciosus]